MREYARIKTANSPTLFGHVILIAAISQNGRKLCKQKEINMKAKRIITAVVCICIVFTMLSACGSSSNSTTNNPSDRYIIKSSRDAINAVKNYGMLEWRLANNLGFNTKHYNSPEFGYEYANPAHDGRGEDCWEVTLKGKMSGYTDQHLRDYKTYSIEITATVRSRDGVVSNIKIMNKD
jgi:hypothetical protein